MQNRWPWLPLTLVLALAACGGDEGAAGARDGTDAAEQAEDDLEDISEYELTTERIHSYYDTQRNVILALKDMSPAEREAANTSLDGNDDLDQMVAKA